MKKLSLILALVVVMLTFGLVGCTQNIPFSTGKYICCKVVVDGTTYTAVDSSVNATEVIGVSYVDIKEDSAELASVVVKTGTWTFNDNVFALTYDAQKEPITLTYDPATGELTYTVGTNTICFKK